MAWPGDEIAAAEGRGRGELRASHADREQAISTLKAAFVQGMLAKDELDQRVGQAFASRTYAELAALTADIPAGAADTSPATAGSPNTPARTMAKAASRSGICLLVAVALAEGAFLADNLLLLVAASFALIAASGFFGYGILDAWQERRSRGQLPQRPDRVHQDLGGGRPGRDTALPGARPDQTRTDMRTHSPRSGSPRSGRLHSSRRNAGTARYDAGTWRRVTAQVISGAGTGPAWAGRR
jgi:hypothetical protein